MLRSLFLYTLLQCILLTNAIAQQVKMNQRDAQQQKQGFWIEEVAEIRGEPGYTWEGTYKNDRKEGVWRKLSLGGSLIAEETYKNNVLNGYCKYYFPNGKHSEEGAYIATELPGQRDTIMVIDPVTNEEVPTEIVRNGNSVRNGVWKLFDEETGKMVKEYYSHGEIVSAAEWGDSTIVEQPVKSAPLRLPHENATKRKKKE